MTKKDNDILARDLVLAAFIVMKHQYESRDAGRAGKLQMFLNIHAGTHGDVKNIVAILNNPKSTVKLSDDQKRIYQRAIDIVESLQAESEVGWVEPIQMPFASIIPNPTGHTLEYPAEISPDEIVPEPENQEVSESDFVPELETPKAKPGRKAKNPIEAATAKAKNKGKACCN